MSGCPGSLCNDPNRNVERQGDLPRRFSIFQ
ncbi:UNVERIFIED_ORG: hypothetical protein HNP28_001511 [Comamonas terrigena]